MLIVLLTTKSIKILLSVGVIHVICLVLIVVIGVALVVRVCIISVVLLFSLVVLLSLILRSVAMMCMCDITGAITVIWSILSESSSVIGRAMPYSVPTVPLYSTN